MRRMPQSSVATKGARSAGQLRVARKTIPKATTIGKDISLVGFDNQPDIASALMPGLTTVQLPHFEMGVAAAKLLIGQYGESAIKKKSHLIKCRFIERDSVARIKN